MIHFRPISLSKSFQAVPNQNIDDKEFKKADQTDVLFDSPDKLINVSPESIFFGRVNN